MNSANLILNIFNKKFFYRKTLLDAGVGSGLYINKFIHLGANITAIDGRQIHLSNIKVKYPKINTIKHNFEAPLNFKQKFNIILSIDTLCHLYNYEQHLTDLCNICEDLILETAVYNTSSKDEVLYLSEDPTVDTLSMHGAIKIPSEKKIEEILSKNKMHYHKINISKLDPNPSNLDGMSIQRQMWFCSKKLLVTNQVRKKISEFSPSQLSKIIYNDSIKILKQDQLVNSNLKVEKSNISLSCYDTSKNNKTFDQIKNIYDASVESALDVSIVIPAFKAQNFLEECLNSISKQCNNTKYEILLGIDSCIETLNWVIKNNDKFKNIKYYWFNDNMGPYVVRNTLTEFVNSDNILFFDADDVMAPTMIKDFIFNIKKAPIVKFKCYSFKGHLNAKRAISNTWYGEGVFGIQKKYFNKLNGFENWKCAADTEFHLRARYNRLTTSSVSNVSFYRRIHSNNLTVHADTKSGSAIRQGYVDLINKKNINKSWQLSKKEISNCELINLNNLSFYEKIVENNQQLVQPENVVKSYENNLSKIEEENITYNVYHCIPWNSSKNLGKHYNDFMSLLKNDDWACFLDGDAIHTTTYFGKNIELIIDSNPDYHLFTCYTNRIGCRYQIAPKVDWSNDSQKYHRSWGEKLWNQNKTKVLDITNFDPLSGVLILINKNSWSQVGGFKEDKMLSIDNDIHLRFKNAGLKVGLMQGIYVQHWYRGGNINQKSHLI